MNPEGDVHVSDDINHGLGTITLLHTLFGVLLYIANSRQYQRIYGRPLVVSHPAVAPPQFNSHPPVPTSYSNRSDIPWDPGDAGREAMMVQTTVVVPAEITEGSFLQLLTACLPHPGYFIAGGVAGVVSRTTTAPLDRLKVYLIAQIRPKINPLEAVKAGAPVEAAKSVASPLINAALDLWRMGGVRSLFAGKH